MAIKIAGKVSSSHIGQLSVKTFQNGKSVYLEPPGNADYKQRTLACGPRKASLLFSHDADGDNILFSLYDFLMEEVADPDIRTEMQDVAREFARMVLKD